MEGEEHWYCFMGVYGGGRRTLGLFHGGIYYMGEGEENLYCFMGVYGGWEKNICIILWGYKDIGFVLWGYMGGGRRRTLVLFLYGE